MGTGASVALSAEKEVEIYRKLQAEYEECRKAEMEDEAVLYERLRKKFHELTAKPEPSSGDPVMSKDLDPSITGGKRVYRSASAEGIAADDVSSMLDIHVGDVVRCRPPGEVLYYEGIVVENYYNGNYLVDFGQEESTETINIKNMQKVMSWNELELKDHVQVKDEDMPIYSNAVITGIHTNGTYDVVYDGSDEKEYYVKPSRIRKVRSNRSKGAEKWALLRNTVNAFGLMMKSPKARGEAQDKELSLKSQPTTEDKALPVADAK